MNQHHIRKVLQKHKLIPVVTFHTMEEVIPMAEKLISQDIHCIEITLRTPMAWEAISILSKEVGHRIDIGVGTILNVDQIEKCKEFNVKFMVSPGFNPDLARAFMQSNIAFIPGVATPSEIMQAKSLGWDTFKFFPANLFGGINALKTYGQLFPDVKFCPTGGIDEITYSDYLALENVISVGGSWMTK